MAIHHTISDGLSDEIIGIDLKKILAGEILEQDLGFLKDATLHVSAEAGDGFFRDMFSDVPEDTALIPDVAGTFGFGTRQISASMESIKDVISPIVVRVTN